MFYQEINENNYHNGKHELIDQLNKFSGNKAAKIFMLIYMEGCDPCNLTRTEWTKLKNILSKPMLNSKKIAVISIDKDLFGNLKYIKNKPTSFPTIRYITNAGKMQENYEDADISSKDRSIDSFVEWIKLKSGENYITNNEVHKQGANMTKINRKTKRKNNRKIKRKINRKTKRKTNRKKV